MSDINALNELLNSMVSDAKEHYDTYKDLKGDYEWNKRRNDDEPSYTYTDILREQVSHHQDMWATINQYAKLIKEYLEEGKA